MPEFRALKEVASAQEELARIERVVKSMETVTPEAKKIMSERIEAANAKVSVFEPTLKFEYDGEKTITFGGHEVTAEQMKNSSRLYAKGEYVASLKELSKGKVYEGLSAEAKKTAGEIDEQMRSAYDEQTGVKEIKTNEVNVETGETLNKKASLEDLSETKTATEFDRTVKDVPELNKSLETFKKEVEKSGSKGKNVGKWVKTILKWGAIGLGTAALVSWLKKHQSEINGCWIVRDSDGKKAKIYELTCSESCRTATLTNTDTPTKKIAELDDFFNDDSVILANYFCLTFKNEEKQTDCTKYITQCVSKTCSGYCSCDKLANDCPVGYTLVCNNVSIWGALTDVLDNVPGILDSLTSTVGSKIIKWLLIIGGILVGVIILLLVVKFLINKFMEKKPTPSGGTPPAGGASK